MPQGDNLPKADEVVIPIEKFTKYALDPARQPNKAAAFESALGYNHTNAHKLVENIRKNVPLFPAKSKGDKGYGAIYEVKMQIIGENGKVAKVATGWLDDASTGEMRLTSAYVDK
jgi:hypothetical protein